MFIGRKAELQFLENKYRQKDGQLIVLYGRRRVGKTETLRQFCKGKPHIFFSCRECTDKMQLKNFSEKLLRENIPFLYNRIFRLGESISCHHGIAVW